jgi:PPM family protein phosphatase
MAQHDEITAEFDARDLARGWSAQESRRESVHTRVKWAARTDIGRVRENNEDKYDVFLPDDPATLGLRGRLWTIADGMGGHAAGQIASEAGLKTLIRTYFWGTPDMPGVDGPSDGEPADALRSSLIEANALLTRAARQFEGGMGTTAVAAVVRDDVLTIAHVGDSRAYLLRDGERVRQLTVDHSWVEEQVRRGTLTRAEAESSPYRNVITRSLGMGDGCEPDTISEKLLPGDRVLLATDGLTGYLDADAIGAITQNKGVARATLDLIDAANDAGGKDNITVLLMEVEEVVSL